MFTKDATVDLLPGQGKSLRRFVGDLYQATAKAETCDARIVEAVSELGESERSPSVGGIYLFATHDSNLYGRVCQHIHYNLRLTPSNNLAGTTEVTTQPARRVDPAQWLSVRLYTEY